MASTKACSCATAKWPWRRVLDHDVFLTSAAAGGVSYFYFLSDLQQTRRQLAASALVPLVAVVMVYRTMKEIEMRGNLRCKMYKRLTHRVVPENDKVPWESFCLHFATNYAWSLSHKKKLKHQYPYWLTASVALSFAAVYPFPESSQFSKLQRVYVLGATVCGLFSLWFMARYHAYNNGLNGLYAIRDCVETDAAPWLKAGDYQKQLTDSLKEQNKEFQSAFAELRNLWKT